MKIEDRLFVSDRIYKRNLYMSDLRKSGRSSTEYSGIFVATCREFWVTRNRV